MKILFFTSILFIIFFNSFSQGKIDTLVIGKYKYPLKKNKIFRLYKSGPVDLPSEYNKFENFNKIVKVDYKFYTDSIDAVELTEDGYQVRIRKPSAPCEKFFFNNEINLYSYTDTIKLTYKEFSSLKPFIKTSNSKIYFYTSKFSCIKNDTLTQIEHRNMANGEIFSYWDSYNSLSETEIKKIKQTTFVLQGLYYLKNNSTFYLDREFIIIVK